MKNPAATAFGCGAFFAMAITVACATAFAIGAHERKYAIAGATALIGVIVCVVFYVVLKIYAMAKTQGVPARVAVPAASPYGPAGTCGCCFREPAAVYCTTHSSRYCSRCSGVHHSEGVCNYLPLVPAATPKAS